MKTIDAIIIHCSATRTGQDLRVKDLDQMHRARGFNQIGYNFIIILVTRLRFAFQAFPHFTTLHIRLF